MSKQEVALTRAEKRCLTISYERNRSLPTFPDTIYAAFNVSRDETLESLCRKGFLIWSSHRGSSYIFSAEARAVVGVDAPQPPRGQP